MHETEALPLPDAGEILSAMHDMADASARVILPHFRAWLDIDDKSVGGAFDPVTAADRDAEAAIRRIVEARFPGHGIVGEEFDDLRPEAQAIWMIDPIDGTRAFIMGLPLWGTLIGLTVNGAPVQGMMNQPFTGERFWGDGATAEFRTAATAGRLRTRPCANLDKAIVTATTPDMFKADGEKERFEAVARAARMRRFGGDCYAYCMLAMGFIDAVIEASLKPFDIVPLIPIIEGAGGIVSAWDGGPAHASSRVVACGDPRLHERLLAYLSG
jgi:histidinol phosphatase-like enzyme (inositol monophosphatase family)